MFKSGSILFTQTFIISLLWKHSKSFLVVFNSMVHYCYLLSPFCAIAHQNFLLPPHYGLWQLINLAPINLYNPKKWREWGKQTCFLSGSKSNSAFLCSSPLFFRLHGQESIWHVTDERGGGVFHFLRSVTMCILFAPPLTEVIEACV
jgi:hypothetical protein